MWSQCLQSSPKKTGLQPGLEGPSLSGSKARFTYQARNFSRYGKPQDEINSLKFICAAGEIWGREFLRFGSILQSLSSKSLPNVLRSRFKILTSLQRESREQIIRKWMLYPQCEPYAAKYNFISNIPMVFCCPFKYNLKCHLQYQRQIL